MAQSAGFSIVYISLFYCFGKSGRRAAQSSGCVQEKLQKGLRDLYSTVSRENMSVLQVQSHKRVSVTCTVLFVEKICLF